MPNLANPPAPRKVQKANREAAGWRLSDDVARAVYAPNGERIGDVRERIADSGQVEFVARDKQQKPIGVFDSWNEAAVAIVRAAWGVR